jgi:mannitol/fructose-specific phosphotransferase system IIA component (Ntr-type)
MTLGTVPTVSDLSLYIPDLKIKKKETALAEMVSCVQRAGVVRDGELLLELLRVRERVGSTGLGKGVAVPYARSVTVLTPRLVVARSLKGIDWAAPDGLPVTLIFMALAPAEWSEETLHGLVGRAAAAARLQRTRQRLLSAPSSAAVAAVMREVSA